MGPEHNFARTLLLCLALALPASSFAATRTPYCDEVSPKIRDSAKTRGLCIDRPATTRSPAPDSATDSPADSAAAAALGAVAAKVLESIITPPACPQLRDFAKSRMSYEAAVNALPKGVRPRAPESRPSVAPDRTVLAQSTELKGRTCWVQFVVSDGSLVRVPPLRDLPEEAAKQRLQENSLKADTQTVESPLTKLTGRVTEQAPAAGQEVPRGSTVKISIARLPMLELPDVVGQDIQAARRQLERFAVASSLAPGKDPLNQVISQVPAGHSRVALGSAVTLRLSDFSLVDVPPLLRLARADAVARLERSQLSVEADESDSEAPMGNVISQDPEAGTTVKRQSTVHVGISGGLPVPKVVGENARGVAATLKAFAVRTEQAESDRPSGEIIAQSPAAGEHASAHSTVTLKVSDGLIALPDLSGMKISEARLTLQHRGGWTSKVLEGYDWSGAIVNATTPAAGQRVERGIEIGMMLKPIPTWAWIAVGAAAAAAIAAVARMLWPLNIKVRPGIDFNAAPLNAVARGPDLPAIGLQAGLHRGPVTAREQEEALHEPVHPG